MTLNWDHAQYQQTKYCITPNYRTNTMQPQPIKKGDYWNAEPEMPHKYIHY